MARSVEYFFQADIRLRPHCAAVGLAESRNVSAVELYANPLLVQLFTRTDLSRRAFRFSVPPVWNSLPQTVLVCDSMVLNVYTHLMLYRIHNWADVDRDRRVGGSRPNQSHYVFVILVTHPKSYIPGAPIKNNPLENILYLRNCSRFFHQIYAVYRGGFRPRIQQIAFKYLV